MKVTYKSHVWKIDLYNKKTKIYWTIKGLIILFIKLQFSIRYSQASKPLHISNSKYLPQPQPQSQWLDGLNTYIIADAFVLSPIRLMISDIHLQRFLHPIKSGLGLCVHRQAWEPLIYLPGGLCHSCHCPDVPEDKVDVCIREKS